MPPVAQRGQHRTKTAARLYTLEPRDGRFKSHPREGERREEGVLRHANLTISWRNIRGGSGTLSADAAHVEV